MELPRSFHESPGPLVALVWLLFLPLYAVAGNCLIQGDKKIGDCENVHVGPARPLVIKSSGHYSGNYGMVTVQGGVVAHLSGNVDDVFVKKSATLFMSGNSGDVRVSGRAEVDGNAGMVYVEQGGEVIIRGIVDGVSGAGKVVRVKGAIVGGAYMQGSSTSAP